jgi:hypothetical protein
LTSISIAAPDSDRSMILLAVGGDDRHCEPVLQTPRDDAFDAPDMIDIGNDLFAGLAYTVGAQRHVARRHVHYLAGMLRPVFKHETAVDLDAHTLKASPFDARRRGIERR